MKVYGIDMRAKIISWFQRNCLYFILLAIILICFWAGFSVAMLAHAINPPENQAAKPADTTPAPYKTEPTQTPTISPVMNKDEPTAAPVPDWETYIATAYCPCERCCGIWAKNRSNGVVVGAAGVELKEGVSIAADWSVLPYGTVIEIQGLGTYIVQDKGGAIKGKRIDIYFTDHKTALAFGRRQVKIRVISK